MKPLAVALPQKAEINVRCQEVIIYDCSVANLWNSMSRVQ
jgi:hypothetical protein